MRLKYLEPRGYKDPARLVLILNRRGDQALADLLVDMLGRDKEPELLQAMRNRVLERLTPGETR